MSTKTNSFGHLSGHSSGNPAHPVSDEPKDLSHLAGAKCRLSEAEIKDLVADSKKSFERFDELLAGQKN